MSKKGKMLKCKICDKEFYVPPYRIKIAKYCSYSCGGKSNKGNVISKRGRINIRNGKLAEKNGMWKGDNIKSMSALHRWVERRLPKPKLCQCCKKKPPYDLANKTGIYNRKLKNWEWLCRSCHMKKDGRLNNLHQFKNN